MDSDSRPALAMPELMSHDDDGAESAELAGELDQHWARVHAREFALAELKDFCCFTTALLDLCRQGSAAAAADHVAEVDRVLREIIQGARVPDDAVRAQLETLIAGVREAFATAAGGVAPAPPPERSAARRAAPPVGRVAEALRRIHVIDTDPAQSKFLALQLAGHGFDTESFSDWAALAQAVAVAPPAALVADLDSVSGTFTGADRFAELRRSGQAPFPVVFLSASQEGKAKLIALRAGGAAYFVKPVSVADLAARLLELLDASEPEPYRVLMVDDDKVFLELQSSRLRAAGFAVRTLADPMEILEAAQDFNPDVLIVDLYMPEADGSEVTRLLHDERAFMNLPIILLSGESDPEAQARVIMAGAVDVMVKPADPARLLERVRARAAQYRRLSTRVRRTDRIDPVTGMPTIAQFTEALEARLAHPDDAGGVLSALLYVILDGYLDWRRRLDAGQLDELRLRIARGVAGHLRAHDIVGWDNAGRLVIGTHQPDLAQLQAFARVLVSAVAGLDVTDLGDGPAITASIGVCRADVGPVHGLIGDAAQLASAQQREGGNGVRLQPQLLAAQSSNADEQRRWVQTINDAVKEGRLFLVFQPISNLVAERCQLFEVLLRMRDPGGQTLLPGQFMPIAARLGLDRLLDRWVVSRALRGLDARQRDNPDTGFFIKLSATSVADPAFPDWLQQMLAKVEVRAESCVFQITESTLLAQPRRARALLEAVHERRQLGGLEHFGGRPEAMSLLDELPVDYVKLDRSLTQGLGADPERQARVRDVARQMQQRGIKLIASFIEDAHSLGLLWQAEIDLVQGNFVQQPDEFIHYDLSL